MTYDLAQSRVMSGTFQDLKISDFVDKLASTMRGLRALESRLIDITTAEAGRSGVGEDSGEEAASSSLNTINGELEDLEIMTGILASKEVILRIQQILREKRNKRRKFVSKKVESCSSIPIDSTIIRKVPAGSFSHLSREVNKAAEQQPTSRSAKRRQRRLQRIAQLYERMQNCRKLYNIRAAAAVDQSGFLTNLDDMEKKLKYLREKIKRPKKPDCVNVNVDIASIPLPSEPFEEQWRSEITAVLFGMDEDAFRSFSALQSRTVGQLLDVRRQWDAYVTGNEKGSSIPICYFLPPSNPVNGWAAYNS
ncbi:uncharacterized protein LOC129586968 [Paramacrobiotus metropolitanus]|uniref:uncharacterized protein LOC129586968 n=1 Tax=Paramacrobiotus metropolitanus TaxID=2943436 RepID=UPI0024457C69|nr:uncharacterized protein LOC129586968 [Paramacrobiotus metropolitanus]